MNSEVVTGVGDDCSVVGKQVVTTDSMVEGIHFRKEWARAQDLGFKSLAISLSDVAAMGGTPKFAYLGLSLPSETNSEWVDDFFSGFDELARDSGVVLLGGDTTGSLRDIFINTTVIGEVESEPKLRGRAKAGDKLFVTKSLGSSAAGLLALDQGLKNEYELLVSSHVRPQPEVQVGKWLGEQKSVTSMMDLSDGLLLDLKKLIGSSCFGFEVEVEKIPIAKDLSSFCRRSSKSVYDFACSGGEDYSLLFTVDGDTADRLAHDCFRELGRELHCIGRVVDDVTDNPIRFLLKGDRFVPETEPFSHFKETLDE